MLIWISSNAELGPIFALLEAQRLKGFAVLLSIVFGLLSICWFCIFHFLFFSTHRRPSHACKNICTYLLEILWWRDQRMIFTHITAQSARSLWLAHFSESSHNNKSGCYKFTCTQAQPFPSCLIFFTFGLTKVPFPSSTCSDVHQTCLGGLSEGSHSSVMSWVKEPVQSVDAGSSAFLTMEF